MKINRRYGAKGDRAGQRPCGLTCTWDINGHENQGHRCREQSRGLPVWEVGWAKWVQTAKGTPAPPEIETKSTRAGTRRRGEQKAAPRVWGRNGVMEGAPRAQASREKRKESCGRNVQQGDSHGLSHAWPLLRQQI